jgi:hypothetical protein
MTSLLANIFPIFGIFDWPQVLCFVLLIALVGFLIWYRKRQM